MSDRPMRPPGKPPSEDFPDTLSRDAIRDMFYELRAHQIELEMQNDELRRTQAELDASRSRYFDLYDLAPVGYCTINQQGQILQANLSVATMLGIPRSALILQPVFRFIFSGDQDIFYLHHTQLTDTHDTRSCELRLLKANGQRLWALLSTTAAREADGTPVLHIVLSDITARKIAAMAVHESEARFRALVEYSPVGIAAHRNLKIIYANPAALTMFGATSAHELVGRHFLDLVHPDFHQPELIRTNRKAPHNVPSPMTEQTLLRLDGSTIDAEVQSISTSFDGLPTTQVVIRDISERRRLGQILHEKNLELERARHIAEEASSVKSTFLSSMSHEMRTPLSAILGFAQLIESDNPPPTPSQKRSVDQILHAGWYLLQLINDILDLAQIESGKLSLALEPIPLAGVIQECKSMMAPQAQAQAINLIFTPMSRMPYVNADRTRLKQAMINLLSNAIKYNRDGGTVQVRCLQTSPERLRITVADTGEGLPPDKLAQLFQPFNRLGRDAGPAQGTGIGLVVCKQLIELMGGTIGVESIVGEGSVFWLELNLATAPAEGQEPAVTHSVTSPLSGNIIHAHKLLYIEDNPANMRLIADLVARRPEIRLLAAQDATQGLDIARTQLPDVILMDINLPGISGIQALKILADDPSTAHIPVIALSANAMARDIRRGLDAGFFNYLTKPINIVEFMDAMDLALRFASTHAATSDKQQ